jgi:hypothetical protein
MTQRDRDRLVVLKKAQKKLIKQAKEALRQSKLGLVLPPEKTRMVELRRGRGRFVFLGCTIRKKRSYSAEPTVVFYAPMAVAQGHEATPGPCSGDHRCAAKREGCEAGHRGTESRT